MSQPRRRKRPQNIPLLVVGGIAAVLIILVIVVLSKDGDQANQPEEVDITLISGEIVNLADYRGQVVVINFWATWCPPCRAEMPELDVYYRDHQSDGLVMLAVNSGEAPAAAQAYFQDFGFVIPVGIDYDGSLSNHFGVTGLPVTIVIDAEGTIHYRHTGMITRDTLDAKITPLLAAQ
ncbi:MAG: TlpA family protein disulfide reductase [Anaerolineae bacterium]|nr:TlpA family protein disulfide reductase [Anaerolineae bacterium]